MISLLTSEKQDEYSDHRLWEVQRILTALKRKQRNLLKQKNENEKKEQKELEELLEQEKYTLIEQVTVLYSYCNTKSNIKGRITSNATRTSRSS